MQNYKPEYTLKVIENITKSTICTETHVKFYNMKNNLLDPENMQEAETEMFTDLAPCGSHRWLAMWLGSALKKKE